jgi:multidrug resistance protein, MATE family
MLGKYTTHYLQLLKLAIPLVLTQAGQMSIQLIDNAMVGRFGTAELAASSFANNVYLVMMLLGLGVFMGITPLVSHARGARNDQQLAATMKSGFVLSLLLIPAITLVSWSLIWIIPRMGQTEEVVRLAIPYYRTLVIANIPFILFILLKQTGEGLGNTFVAMAATIAANILKVVLNYALIFGNLGFPRLGLLGAGYATIIARIALALLLYAGFLYLKPIRHYFVLMGSAKTAWNEIAKIMKIGIPISVQLALEVSVFSFSAIMMGWMGNVPLASHEIAIGLASFTFMIANGVAMATTIRVSYQLGIGDHKSLEREAYSAVHLVLFYMGCCALGYLLLRHELPGLFTRDPSVISTAASLLAVAALFQLFDGLQTVSLGILRGFADVRVPLCISVFSYLIVGLSVSYLCAFPLNMGPKGIWYGFLAGLSFAGCLLAFRIRRKIRSVKFR